ncbi:A/G-specific adenine glycosylase [Phocicoccus pinnipedialis]|uniref:Adenine DNA glycosylase n=1 Tax=Phocicoccus pinnipedialis TaxID=110845 RepID=A0A6V7RM86_9BACL|nr:A/G-specific adenine glycosylase [Jeotgalicoccus pinnipedialis]MBP1940252.1 A/G-specific adenine glycosylase [Jeotgalicoccus pinnipedialis]CAD2079482.1 putative A/G-specific adenine glycosylase YfhQ [Jeotgalicoccus pinnipedialis]
MLNKNEFALNLLEWYHNNKRDLPWRRTNDPYKIWLSEVMLQQTQVQTVIPYYNKFTTKYPTLDDLANAEEQDILKDWEGLGYYNRIRNLHLAVKEVQSSYDSIVPNEPEPFLALKGVGPYIGGAVQSIAFNHRIAAVDGNVLRVMARLNVDDRDISKQSTVRSVKLFVETIIPLESGDFNQALMELGATVCTPRIPKCVTCPVQSHCESFKSNSVLLYPKSTKSKKKTELYFNVFLILNNKDEIYMFKNDKNLLKGMYKFPKYDIDTSIDTIEEALNLKLSQLKEPIAEEKHVFTHQVWYMNVYLLYTNSESQHFVKISEVNEYPISVAMQKVFKHLH